MTSNTMNFKWEDAKQLTLLQIILAFLAPSLFAFTGFRIILPKIVERGASSIVAWSVTASIMLFLFCIVAIVLLNKEAKTLGITLSQRMCLKKLSLKKWGIYVGLLLLGLIGSSALNGLTVMLSKMPMVGVPSYYPFFLNPTIDPLAADMSVISPNLNLSGAYYLIPLMMITLLLNILTEELYFRAYLLPKMQSLGKMSWVVNGVLFAFYHIFQLWMLPVILVGSLIFTYSVQKSRSIKPAFALHLIANTLNLLAIVYLIAG